MTSPARSWRAFTRAAVVGASIVAGAACNVGLYAGPDRPDDTAVLGPAPPAAFHCERGARHTLDEDRDSRKDSVIHVVGGAVVCRGEDTDRNGRLDRWQLLRDGKVIEEDRDTDGDGTLDEQWLLLDETGRLIRRGVPDGGADSGR